MRERNSRCGPKPGTLPAARSSVTHRQQAVEPQKIGAALNAYDREFPHGRYADDIRNLRGLLAWRTQDWRLAVDLTLQTMTESAQPQPATRRPSDGCKTSLWTV